MMRRLTAVVWLTVVWIALWEDLTWANVLAGVLVAIFVMWVTPARPAEAVHSVRPWALLKLSAYFLWKLSEASTILAWEVVTPRNRVNPAIVAVPLRSRSPGIVTLVSNMVSLTPGTLTLQVDEETMTIFIHVLHLETIDDMRREVRHLEELAVAAFPLRRLPGAAPIAERSR